MGSESPLRKMKNAFYFTLKALLKIFKLLSWLFGHVQKRFDYKNLVNFKIYDEQTDEQTIAIYILTNISRSKDNKTTKPGQLMEYNMKHIFLEKSYVKFGRETIPRPFSKKIKMEYTSGSIF